DYAETLKAWRENFNAAEAKGRLPTDFDRRFCDLWRFYLMYCEGGFRGGAITVSQATLVKRRGSAAVRPIAAIARENVVVHDRAEQAAECASNGVVLPPHDFGLQRFEARQGQPANGARMHPRDGRGRKPGKREIVHHRLKRPRARSTQLR